MKYIRTKDGKIFEEQTELSYLGITYYKSKRYTNRFLLNETLDTFFCRFGGIEKQADTIEELCDEFVVSKDNKYRSLVKIEETGNRWVEDKITQWCEILKNKLVNWDIYGAIWTDKGLIYVAKMNEKGELELL